MFAVELTLYASYFAGLFLLFAPQLSVLRRQLSLAGRLDPGRKSSARRTRFGQYIVRLLDSSVKREIDPDSFMTLLAFLFVFVFLLAIRSFRFIPAALIAGCCAGLPVLLLAVRLESDRSKSSREGVSLVTEIYRQYMMCGKNMLEALEAAVSGNGDYPACRRHLYRLLLRLRSAGGSSEIRECIDTFSFALGTVWGKMLATCIRLSSEKGTDVSAGLADIIAQLKRAGRLAEERKRLNSEASRMTLFLVPVLYAATILLSVRYLDVPPAKLLRNQFLTPEGTIFFIGIVFLFVFDLVLLRAVENARLDY